MNKEEKCPWPLNLKQIDELKAKVNKRLEIESRKLEIFEKKLEECKQKNIPLPPESCDAKMLNDAKDEVKQCNIALVKLAAAEQIASLKTGDRLICFSDGYRQSDRTTGFKMLDFEIALRRAQDSHWYHLERLDVAELEIDERREDGKMLAHSIHGKTKFLGIPVNEDVPILFYRIIK